MNTKKTLMRGDALTSRLVSAAIATWAKHFAQGDDRDDHSDRDRHPELIAQHQHRWGRY
jgi:hypothetical protein